MKCKKIQFPYVCCNIFDWSVVRPSRLLWEIDMIIRMLANIHIMSWKATKIFLEDPEVTVVTLWNPLFEVKRSSGTYIWVWFPKNHHWLAFPPVEIDLRIVRPPRLLWEIGMIMSNLPNTNFMPWKAKENFLQGPEVTVVILWNPLLEVNWRGKTTIWE